MSTKSCFMSVCTWVLPTILHVIPPKAIIPATQPYQLLYHDSNGSRNKIRKGRPVQY